MIFMNLMMWFAVYFVFVLKILLYFAVESSLRTNATNSCLVYNGLLYRTVVQKQAEKREACVKRNK